ncbi:Nephrocystin-3 [Orbilia brochopaga]|nr:Nephrocystin-3 [Drechslerella brochopaga]
MVNGSRAILESRNLPRESTKEVNFVVPYPQNLLFVGRTEELKTIHENFTKPRPTDTPCVYAITGTGGMGKTQIALQYAYQYRNEYTAIFWVSAASEDAIRTSFTNIMQHIIKEQARVMWSDRGDSPDYQAIGSKLGAGMQGLVDVNGKITTSANSEAFQNIRSALLNWLQSPDNSPWMLIFDNADDLETLNLETYLPTQGRGDILITSRRPEFSPELAQSVELDGLESESAVALLLKSAHLTDTSGVVDEAKPLVEKLGFMPLAISHAGCYLHKTKLPVEEYISQYERSFMVVQSAKPQFGWNYRNDTAATTWEISFSQIQVKDNEAAQLLLLCSYLNPEEIFEDLWHVCFGDVETQLLPEILPRGEEVFENQDLFEHLHNIARVLFYQGKYDSAMDWFQQALVGKETGLGQKHPSTLATAQNIALVLLQQRKLSDALQQFKRVLAKQEAVLGPSHRSTLSSMFYIAIVLSEQKEYDEAIQHFERLLAFAEVSLDMGYPSTLDITRKMAVVFSKQGRHDEAMQHFEQALAGTKAALGENHLKTLDILDGIAKDYYSRGDHEKAMQCYEKVLTGLKTVLGETHPSTLTTMHNIAMVFCDQGKYKEALQQFNQTLAVKKAVLGDDHPSTLKTGRELHRLMDYLNLT